MENKKIKEFGAVIFTFLVMGAIGLSIYQPDESVMSDDTRDKVVETAAITGDASNSQPAPHIQQIKIIKNSQ